LISEIAKKAFDLELNSGNFIYGNQHIADAILKMLTAFYPLLFIFILLLKSDLVTDTDFRIRIRIFTADTDGYRRISAGILVLSVSISVSMTRSGQYFCPPQKPTSTFIYYRISFLIFLIRQSFYVYSKAN